MSGLLAAPSAVDAQDLQTVPMMSEARAALDRGEFDHALGLSQSLGTPEALILAAEALSSKILLCETSHQRREAKQARQYAEQALLQDPENFEALLQYALAEGFVTRASNPISVWRKKMPQKLLESVTRLKNAAPDDGRADALLGAWHFGIIRKAGEKNGAKWYEASIASGRQAYEAALVARPDDLIITSNYAFSLLDFDPDTYNETARDMLLRAAAQTPRDVVEAGVQNRVKQILTLWETEAATEEAGRFLDGKPFKSIP